MLTCRKCIERMKPDDPRIKSGRYHLCGCDYCNKPTYYRELEEVAKETKVEYQRYVSYQKVDGKQLATLRKNLTAYLDEKLNECFDKKKQTDKYKY